MKDVFEVRGVLIGLVSCHILHIYKNVTLAKFGGAHL